MRKLFITAAVIVSSVIPAIAFAYTPSNHEVLNSSCLHKTGTYTFTVDCDIGFPTLNANGYLYHGTYPADSGAESFATLGPSTSCPSNFCESGGTLTMDMTSFGYGSYWIRIYMSNDNWYIANMNVTEPPPPPAAPITATIATASSTFTTATGFGISGVVGYMRTILMIILGSGLGLLSTLFPYIIGLVIVAGIVYFVYRAFVYFRH